MIMLMLMFALLTDEQQELIRTIFEENKHYFYRMANRTLHSDADAWEAVSIATLKIIENIEKISNIPCPQMTAFCVTIVKNTAIDMIRKSNKSTCLEEFENIGDKTVDSFEDAYIHKSDLQRLTQIVSTLSQEDQMLIELKYSQDKSYSEIGTLLNLTEDAAKKRGQRIIKKLKNLYEMG